MALKVEDFKHYKRLAENDISHHNNVLRNVNRPEEVISAYQGLFHEHGHGDVKSDQVFGGKDMMIENYLFIFASTALPSLYFQVPRIIVRSKRDNKDLQFQASVLNEWANVDFNEQAKTENQLAIIDALMPYGFACIKNAYNSRTGVVQKGRASLLTGETKGKVNENDAEGDVEFIRFEKSIGIRQSPKYTYLDKTQPFGKGNRITFQYRRTLQEIIESNLYKLSSNFISHFSAKSKEKRDVELDLYEMWIMKAGLAHKLVWVDGWDEELAWTKTKYQQLPVSLLRFNKMGDVLYNVSHGTLGLSAQKELNYLNEVWKEHIDNVRNQVAVHLKGLTESGRLTLQQNKIGGIVETTQPIPASAVQPIQSAPMDPNIFNNIINVREYLKLLLSVTGGKGGGPDSKLATIERNKALGDALRSAGLQDEIRTFMIDQVKQRIKNVLRLGSPEMILKMTGENLVDPLTGNPIKAGDEIRIGEAPGIPLRDIVTGDIDMDFVIDVDITSASKPDYPVIRKQIIEGATFIAQIEGKLNAERKKMQWALMAEDFFSTFDSIPDAKKYITDLPPENQQGGQALLDALPEGGVPTEGNIETGANAVPTGTEGLGV